MPNDFLTPSTIAKTVLANLYNDTVLLPLVWRAFDPDFRGKQGATVQVRKPTVFTALEFDRAVGTTVQNADEDSVNVTLDKLIDVSFPVTTEELLYKIEDFDEQLMAPAMEAIAQKVDGDIAEALVDAAEGVGGGGTVTMSSVASDVFTGADGARSKLGREKIPRNDRFTVLSPEAVGVALADPLFVQADRSGSTDALRDASIGRVFGFDSYESQVLGYGAGDRGQADGVAFQRQAVAIATAALPAPMGLPPAQVAIETYKGLTVRVTRDYSQTYKQDVISIDTLYGVNTLRAKAAVQLSMGLGS